MTHHTAHPLSPIPERRIHVPATPSKARYDGILGTIRATRAWIRAQKPGAQKHARAFHLGEWYDAFMLIDCPPAAYQWDSLLRHLAHQAHTCFLAGCSCCGAVSDDEKRILSAINAIQRGRQVGAIGILAHWFDRQHQGYAMDTITLYAEIMLARGHIFSDGLVPDYDLASADLLALNGTAH